MDGLVHGGKDLGAQQRGCQQSVSTPGFEPFGGEAQDDPGIDDESGHGMASGCGGSTSEP
jgi:hypothetical protein